MGPLLFGVQWSLFAVVVVALVVVTIVLSTRQSGQINGLLIAMFGFLLAVLMTYSSSYNDYVARGIRHHNS